MPGPQGNLESLEKQYWPVIGILFTIAVVTAVSQFFMISRYWQMSVQLLLVSDNAF
jgi:hypothetical protein